jgi:hypothetical protein
MAAAALATDLKVSKAAARGRGAGGPPRPWLWGPSQGCLSRRPGTQASLSQVDSDRHMMIISLVLARPAARPGPGGIIRRSPGRRGRGGPGAADRDRRWARVGSLSPGESSHCQDTPPGRRRLPVTEPATAREAPAEALSLTRRRPPGGGRWQLLVP